MEAKKITIDELKQLIKDIIAEGYVKVSGPLDKEYTSTSENDHNENTPNDVVDRAMKQYWIVVGELKRKSYLPPEDPKVIKLKSLADSLKQVATFIRNGEMESAKHVVSTLSDFYRNKLGTPQALAAYGLIDPLATKPKTAREKFLK